ncbi:MAG TPA: rhomboid family intramembrane serine protease [Ferruginibacter sp.]|nr:rhomboid family intramembrane serine protease [Ferruginibacter sp.]HMP21100.1 rhomboid family intramembrane serine protease [Ferruginibacter sp.]
MQFSDYPVTYALIAANVIISLIGFSNAVLVDKAIFWPYRMEREKQYYRFISSGFLHADFMHLFFNMFTLFFFGRAVEMYFYAYALGGNLSYLILYFAGMTAASIPSFVKHKDNYQYRALGASGAVSAVVFACIVFNPWGMIGVYGIPMPFLVYAVLYVVYCVVMSKRSADNINHDAHLWGSIFGLVLTLLLVWFLQPALFKGILHEFTHPHFGR